MWRYRLTAKCEGEILYAEVMVVSGNEAIAKAPRYFPEGAEVFKAEWVRPNE